MQSNDVYTIIINLQKLNETLEEMKEIHKKNRDIAIESRKIAIETRDFIMGKMEDEDYLTEMASGETALVKATDMINKATAEITRTDDIYKKMAELITKLKIAEILKDFTPPVGQIQGGGNKGQIDDGIDRKELSVPEGTSKADLLKYLNRDEED